MAAQAMTRDVDRCPDLETLAAYLDGRLGARERSIVAAHLTTCHDCYFVFREAAQTRVEAEASDTAGAPPSPVMRRRVWWAAVGGALATAAAVWLAVESGAIDRWRGQPELQALVAAVGTERTIEPRLTGGFAYGPLRSAVRGGGDATSVSPDVRIAAAQIEKDAGTSRTQDAMRLLGVAHLVVGEVDRAIPLLEAAATERSADARTFSDLAAAYLVRADRERRSDDLARALQAAERATARDRSLVEAWFNRAIALERAGRRAEASQAWYDYLTIDATSRWADEARQRKNALAASPETP